MIKPGARTTNDKGRIESDGSADRSSAEISGLENFLRSPWTSIRLPGGKRIKLATDSVRAKPAVTPQLSLAIGATAVGLGIWGLIFPTSVKRTFGIRSSAAIVAALFGVRELWSGLSLVNDPTRSDVLWARVGGDVLDLAALGALARPLNPKAGNARLALNLVKAVAVLDVIAALGMSAARRNCE